RDPARPPRRCGGCGGGEVDGGGSVPPGGAVPAASSAGAFVARVRDRPHRCVSTETGFRLGSTARRRLTREEPLRTCRRRRGAPPPRRTVLLEGARRSRAEGSLHRAETASCGTLDVVHRGIFRPARPPPPWRRPPA